MSGMLLPERVPQSTQRLVIDSLRVAPDLVRLLDTPALLVAACCDAQRRADRVSRLCEAARTPQKQLAKAYGLPGLRVLRRVTGDQFTARALADLAELTADPASLRVLRHAKHVNKLLTSVLGNPVCQLQVTSGLLDELGRRPRWRPATYTHLVQTAAFLTQHRPGVAIDSIQRLRDLRGRYGRLIDCYRTYRQQRPAFPPPPFPGEPGYALPLATWRDLIQESVDMRNCCGWHPGLFREVLAGRGYFYRVEGAWGLPRATMFVERNEEGVWRIRHLEKRAAQPVGSVTRGCLAVWVAQRQRIEDENLCLAIDG